MALAYATKDQMRIWKSARKGDGQMAHTQVLLQIKVVPRVEAATFLFAGDGVHFVKRGVVPEADASSGTFAVPAAAIEQAEKGMHKSDRAYFEEDRIVVQEIEKDPRTGIESGIVKAIVPFRTQLKLPHVEHTEEFINKLNDMALQRSVSVDVKVLRRALSQFKHGSNSIFLKIGVREGDGTLLLAAFDNLPGEEILSAVAPIETFGRTNKDTTTKEGQDDGQKD